MDKDKPKSQKRGKYKVPDNIIGQVRELIKTFMEKEKISIQDIALKLEKECDRSPSRTNILNKIHRGTFTLAEFLQILNVYGYEISLKKAGRTTSGTIYS